MDSKKAAGADKKYSESVDAFRHLQDKFYDEEMPRLLDVRAPIPRRRP